MTTTAKPRRALPPHGTRARAVGRPHTGIPACDCPLCKKEIARYAKRRKYLIANGQTLKVTAQRAQRHLVAVRASGVTWTQLEAETGLKRDTLIAVARGDRLVIRRETEKLILAARPEPSPEAPVSALGSQRRLRALMADGHRLVEVAAYGVNVDTIAKVVNGSDITILARTAQTIARAYAELSATPGDYTRNRNRAQREGWPGSAAWHPDDLDAPEALPDPGLVDTIAVQRAIAGESVELSRAERMEVTRLLTEQGRPAHEIADLVGVAPRTVTRWRVANEWRAAA